jgi:hypothetical protein
MAERALCSGEGAYTTMPRYGGFGGNGCELSKLQEPTASGLAKAREINAAPGMH